MKYLKLILSGLLVIVISSGLALGQRHDRMRMHQPDSANQGMMMQGQMGGMMGMMQAMGGRGMQRMMNNPVHRSMMYVHVLPTMADTLGLSNDQVAQLEKLQQEFQKERQQAMETMMSTRKEMHGMMQGDTPDPDQVRALMQKMAGQHADMMATGYEIGTRMRQVLTEEQQERLGEMSPQQMQRHMMSGMSMTDMMQMMRMMRGGMMGGGRMGPMMDGSMRGPGGQ